MDRLSEMVTTEIAAQVMGISESTLNKMRCRGEGPVFVKIGRTVRYRRSDIQKYMDKNTIDPERVHAFSA